MNFMKGKRRNVWWVKVLKGHVDIIRQLNPTLLTLVRKKGAAMFLFEFIQVFLLAAVLFLLNFSE